MKTTGLNTREKAVSQELYYRLKNKGEININRSRLIAIKDRIIISLEKIKNLYHSSDNQDYLQNQANILKDID